MGDNFEKLRFVFENDALRLKMREHFVLRIIHNLPYSVFEIDTPEEMHKWYVNFMKGKKVSTGNSCGRGDLGLVYAFQNNVPNNCLPILFYENEQLVKLLKKRG